MDPTTGSNQLPDRGILTPQGFPIWPELAGIHVLVVLDGRASVLHSASFGPINNNLHFGLSRFIETLTQTVPHFTRLFVTKAHREPSDQLNSVYPHAFSFGADIQGFKFDTPGLDLSIYDVIFLFGVAGDQETDALISDTELVALTAFMDGGGGVFATGDHEDLGAPLNGRIPRVRSMRKWYNSSGAPSGLGADRIETTQPDPRHDPFYPGQVSFDNQSDDIPQPITLRWYGQHWNWLNDCKYPHPLLCGTSGPILVMPDHMHEGEVIEPINTEADPTEYPISPDGTRPLPEIVAWGRSLHEISHTTEHHTVGDSAAIPRLFGVVGAYDGHRAGIGRVAVDSTWHHFFDINLIGDPEVPRLSLKNQGFLASSEGLRVLAEISTYHRNLATWLARSTTQARIFATAAWYALNRQPLAMIVNPRRNYSQADLVSIGTLALRTLSEVSPPCVLLVALIPYFNDDPLKVFPPDPWALKGPADHPSIDPNIILRVALGGAIIALGAEREKLMKMEGPKAAQYVSHLVKQGVIKAMHGLSEDLGKLAEGLNRISHAFEMNKPA